jgi:hypothetical protein
MRKTILLMLFFTFLLVTAGQAQYGIQRSIRNKVKRDAREHALNEEEKARVQAEDEADRC